MSSPPSFSSAAIGSSDHPQLHQEHTSSPSLSDVRSSDKSYTGNQIPIPEMYVYQPTDKPLSFSALERDQGNSHKNTEAAPAPDYYNYGQPPTIGSIENRHKNSQPSGAAAAGDNYDGYDLPPSRNHVAPRMTSQTGNAAIDENLVSQPYGQLSITGRSIKKIEPPEYYKK